MEKVLIILLFIFFIIAFPFPFEVRACFDVKHNRGYFTLWLGKIQLNISKFKIKNNALLIKTKKKRIEKEFEVSRKQFLFAKMFQSALYEKLSVRKVSIHSRVGLSNPFYSAMLGGVVNSLFLAVLIKIKNKKIHSKIQMQNNVNFKELTMIFALKMNVFISLLDILLSFLLAIKMTKKELKYERQTVL